MDEAPLQAKSILHETFEIGLLLKGLNGFLEIIGSFLFFVISPVKLNNLIILLTRGELSEDPKDFVANYLLNLAGQYSLNTQIFGSLYLFSHGIIKIFLIIWLWRRKLWAYPTAIIFFFIFIIYQIYRYTINYSPWLIILTIFDIFIIYLTYREYKNLKKLS